MDAPQPGFTAGAWTVNTRQRNGLGVAALVLGVASLVAAASFFLFPLALVGGALGFLFGIFGLVRVRHGDASNTGQATAGLILSLLALALAVVLTTRVGTWAKDNREPLRRLGTCLTKAKTGTETKVCFGTFANEVKG